MAVLEWTRESGLLEFDARLCGEAAQAGHVNVLEWLREHKLPWSTTIYSSAA